jgi:NADPH:quinone reductase-like Zn-dependent oxidoreductase
VAYPNGVEPAPRARGHKLRVSAYDAVASPREFDHLEQAVEKSGLRVPIASVYPLARTAEAHKKLDQGHIVGRLALRIRRGD